MKQYTISHHLTRTIHRLKHILAKEAYPAIRAAELVAATLFELAQKVPEAEQQIKEIVCLYEECADKQYGSLYRSNHTRQCQETL